MPVDVPAGPPTFQLPEALELTAAAPLTEALLRRVGEDLILDAGAVRRLGASCLQVLIAAARAWKAEGDSLTLDRPSPRFLEDLSLLGYEPKSLLNGAASS
jgi:chemotaxis protein CheX